ncbi:hypothetical protein KM043_011384 [Ampulex compressa]|nr:hypothetical protein KM043_011384 [Ampulex compressa]
MAKQQPPPKESSKDFLKQLLMSRTYYAQGSTTTEAYEIAASSEDTNDRITVQKMRKYFYREILQVKVDGENVSSAGQSKAGERMGDKGEFYKSKVRPGRRKEFVGDYGGQYSRRAHYGHQMLEDRQEEVEESLQSCPRSLTEDAGLSLDGKWLRRNMSVPLKMAIKEIVAKRPFDPIEYLGFWLLNYKKSQEDAQQRKELDRELLDLRSSVKETITKVQEENRIPRIKEEELVGEEGQQDLEFKYYDSTGITTRRFQGHGTRVSAGKRSSWDIPSSRKVFEGDGRETDLFAAGRIGSGVDCVPTELKRNTAGVSSTILGGYGKMIRSDSSGRRAIQCVDYATEWCKAEAVLPFA